MPETTPLANTPIPLHKLAVVRVAGADRVNFLQGQLTQDVTALSPTRSLLAGWASAKGRLLVVTQLIDWCDAIWLPVNTELAEPITNRLRMFVLRAEVSVEISENLVLGAFDDALPEGMPDQPGATRSDDNACATRLIGDPTRSLLLTKKSSALFTQTASEDRQAAWALADVQTGLPAIFPETSETFVPQMLNLDILNGISFTKGCYVGQEIVARTQNLGRIKRRMFRLRCDSAPQLNPGSLIYGPDTSTGRVVSCAADAGETELLAVIPINQRNATFYADKAASIPLRMMPLPYDLPESGSP